MVFKGLELPDYEKLGFWYMDEMSTIVDIVINDPYSIGYSIMTYLEDVYANENLKAFAVNGALPSAETVKDKYDAKIADGLVPTGRWGYPEDVAKAVVALVDGTFAYTTGESFIVDGGLHIRKL